MKQCRTARVTRITESILLPVLFWCGSVSTGWAGERTFADPYASINWDEANPYYANLHTHTVYSDGEYAPQEAIDAYKKLGYHILALTDHENDHYAARPAILYPWTELESIYREIEDRPNPSWRWQNTPYGEISEAWRNRDPAALDMISIRGVEVSRTHHLASLFNAYAGNTTSEETAFVEIGKRGGLSKFLHPGRYERYPAWYIYFYKRHDHLIGMEVFNQEDRYPGDRALWDRVLHRMMPDRPVWGFAGDDMHVTDHLGWNYNIFPLPRPSKPGVRSAIESGAFYFYKPREQMTAPRLHLTRVRASRDRIRLLVDGAVDAVQWITYNPSTRQSEVVHEGAEISMSDVPSSATFVRARIVGAEGTAYTQPFGVRGTVPREEAAMPEGDLQDPDGWKVYVDEGAELHLDTGAGKSGHALKMSYDLTGGHWVSVIKPAGRISEQAIIRFDVRGDGRANSVELKLEDGGGATYGQHLPMKSDDATWYRMDIAVADLNYWWGGDEALNLSRVGLSFAIVKRDGDQGGTGTVYLDNISIRDESE